MWSMVLHNIKRTEKILHLIGKKLTGSYWKVEKSLYQSELQDHQYPKHHIQRRMKEFLDS